MTPRPAGRLPRRTTLPEDDSPEGPEDDSPGGRLPHRTTPPDVIIIIMIIIMIIQDILILRGSRPPGDASLGSVSGGRPKCLHLRLAPSSSCGGVVLRGSRPAGELSGGSCPRGSCPPGSCPRTMIMAYMEVQCFEMCMG